MDERVCHRAPWLVQQCELTEQHILNGKQPGDPARFTCHTGKGSSTIDYILSRDPTLSLYYDPDTLEGYTDHTLLYTCLPVEV